MHKVGIIGLGNWGSKPARNFHELPDAKLEMYQAWKGWSFADNKTPSPWLTLAALRIFRRAEAG